MYLQFVLGFRNKKSPGINIQFVMYRFLYTTFHTGTMFSCHALGKENHFYVSVHGRAPAFYNEVKAPAKSKHWFSSPSAATTHGTGLKFCVHKISESGYLMVCELPKVHRIIAFWNKWL